ncbi:putative protein serine/threonine kinase [Heterostelium album PN500]|uniref:Protein kinase domain-containing protein n=1 Tax=Heterostelium pallidum (strain ATCC 26659 / Pp 5 / PN500) TaxID=670386 RepID=D3BUJ1_HETP5|nr:putative protein serine/threonine kinase [Heterostelium album PN500]EFA74779.1 putative protein serine/threonine kinase [Heterostelium album PN500]|eukprot:XP_020426913.1 putative protein serine/threonine kinase [Heterostelium album PN500]
MSIIDNNNKRENNNVVLKREFKPFSPCRSVDCYKKLNTINEGAFGVVYKAMDKETNEIVALKKIKTEHEKEGFPLTSVREIRVLMELKHPHLVNSWVVHRDLKTANLLYTNCGELKIADLGLAREYGSPLRPLSEGVVTLWYRAPELLLGTQIYSTPIDIWSVGCIFAEIISREVLLPGTSEIDQLDRIFKLLGTPNEQIWDGFNKLPLVKNLNLIPQPYNNLKNKFPHITDQTYDLLSRLLTYDPEKRITAAEALEHPYFKENPPPRDTALMPIFPTTHKTS